MKSCLIIWSVLAEETYLKTLAQIFGRWTVKEIEKFEEKVEILIEKLKIQKRLCPFSDKQKSLRRCVITSQTSLVYRIKDDNTIELVTFFDNRSKHTY